MKKMIARPAVLIGTFCALAVAISSLTCLIPQKHTPTAHSTTTECTDADREAPATNPIIGNSIIFESMTGHLLSIHL